MVTLFIMILIQGILMMQYGILFDVWQGNMSQGKNTHNQGNKLHINHKRGTLMK